LRNSSARVPLVSVIILNLNGLTYLGDGLKECLDSAINCDYQEKEVIFVDNGSVDGTADFVQHNYAGKVLVIRNGSNLGFSEGFNVGIRASRGEFVALLSNDMVVEHDWLKPMVNLMQSNPNIGLTGCKRLAYGKTGLLDGIGGDLYLCGRVKNVGFAEIDRGQYDVNIGDLGFIGGSMVIRRRVLEEVGLFDPCLFIFCEDIDLCFRIRKAGYRVVYVYDAILYHRGSSTLTGVWRSTRGQMFTQYMIDRNRIRTNLIHFRVRRIFSAFLIDFVWLVIEPKAVRKILLLKAYGWNLKHIGATMRKRHDCGPSPPYGCKYGLHLSFLSALLEWKHKRQIARLGNRA